MRHLTPEQARHQVAYRLRAALPAGRPPAVPAQLEVRPDWMLRQERVRGTPQPGAFAGRFDFWGRERRLDLRKPWIAAGEGKSWNYLVHYFEHAPALAAEARATQDEALRDALCAHLASWIDAHPAGRGVAWEPYPTALRIVNWLDVVQLLGAWADAAWRERMLRSVYVQAAWLAQHLEWHLQGTHLLKDAKALAFAGRVFGDRQGTQWSHLAADIVRRELARHVRRDGGHVEPSVVYHALAFEDVLDLLNLYAQGEGDEAWRAMLLPPARAMLAYLQAVRPPGGGYPLLGDAAVDLRPSAAELIDYAARLGLAAPAPREGLSYLADSGLAVWRSPALYVLADVGGVGPPHLPGHGHCDSLSFEWHIAGVPFLVDSGTQSYEPGPAREASRSTRAHNTLVINAREQHEMWAAFRVARRSTVSVRLENATTLDAELTPWFDRWLRVRRKFSFEPRGTRIHDRVEGPGLHAITSRLHLHPECRVKLEGNVVRLQRGAHTGEIRVTTEAQIELVDPERSGSVYCASFGKPIPNAELRIHYDGALPWECQIELRVAD